MSNGSSNKKVAKAASAGGGNLSRRARSSSSSFNLTIIGTCLLGIALVVGSVIGRTVLESPPYSSSSKKVKSALSELQKLQKQKNPDAKKLAAAAAKYNELNGATHVHSAYGVWNCDKYVSPFDASQLPDTLGIHAHEDGLLHIHPFVNRAAGKKARMQLFFDAVKMSMSTKKLSWIADTTGTKFTTLDVDKNKCNGKKAEIWLQYWEVAAGGNLTKTSTKYVDNFGDIRLTGESAYAFVFAPKGTKVPLPPSVAALDAPSDVPTTESTTGSTLVPSSTVVPSSTLVPSSTVAGSPTSTVAGSPTSTVAGSPTSTVPAATTVASTAAVPTTVKK